MISSNYVDGTRFRLSGMTTAKLNPRGSLMDMEPTDLKTKNGNMRAM